MCWPSLNTLTRCSPTSRGVNEIPAVDEKHPVVLRHKVTYTAERYSDQNPFKVAEGYEMGKVQSSNQWGYYTCSDHWKWQVWSGSHLPRCPLASLFSIQGCLAPDGLCMSAVRLPMSASETFSDTSLLVPTDSCALWRSTSAVKNHRQMVPLWLKISCTVVTSCIDQVPMSTCVGCIIALRYIPGPVILAKKGDPLMLASANLMMMLYSPGAVGK